MEDNKDYIKELLERLHDKVDEVKAEQSEQKVILARQEVHLAEHMKRSDYLEKLYEGLKNQVSALESHKDNVVGVFKFIGGLSVLVGLVVGIAKIIALF